MHLTTKINYMIQITEENLKNGINMGLGSKGIWTPELSKHIFDEIFALRQLAVIRSVCDDPKQPLVGYCVICMKPKRHCKCLTQTDL